eukprot:829391-Amphidinium_carterae.1
MGLQNFFAVCAFCLMSIRTEPLPARQNMKLNGPFQLPLAAHNSSPNEYQWMYEYYISVTTVTACYSFELDRCLFSWQSHHHRMVFTHI